MGFWGWATILIWVMMFCCFFHMGWKVDYLVPAYSLVILMIGGVGFFLGYGAKVIRILFF